MDNKLIKNYWDAFLATLPPDAPYHNASYTAEYFGDNPTLADQLAEVIVSGRKTATCSCLWEWEAEEEDLPQPGLVTIVLDGKEEPVAIIETTEVTIKPFNKVDAQFASEEGEGDQTLEYWRQAHTNYFNRVLPKIDKQFAEDIPLVCERFKLIYK